MNKNRKNLATGARKNSATKRVSRVKNIRTLNNKIFLLMFFLALFFIGGIVRLFYLQVIASDDLTRRALIEMTKTENIYSDRGLILDRNGKKLAINVSASNVFFDLSVLNSKTKEEKAEYINNVAEKVALITKVSKEELLEKLQGEKRVKLLDSVDRDKTLDLRGLNIYGLIVEDQIKRFYPFNNLASHTIGFINAEGIGQYGLEASFNSKLTGLAGKTTALKDRGNSKLPISDEQVFAPKEGLNLVTTIDENIQKFVEEEALKAVEKADAKRVSIIVQNPKTGEILALTNKPDYNLNFPKSPSKSQGEDWNNLSNDEKQDEWFKTWRNFLINDLYEPGSTFKAITAAASLEEDSTNPEKHYYCTGYVRDIPGVLVRCSSLPNPHGDITMERAFAESCNPTFVNLARELGKEKMYKYIQGFGFGERTGIELPGEEKGLIPESAQISDAKLATISYGHGIATTPLQMVNSISAIVNGGNLLVPKIVKELRDQDGEIVKQFPTEIKRQVISKETSEKMLNLMEGVVLNGTGTRAKVNGYRVGGKSGTADKVSDKGGYEEDKYYSSFVAVAPLNDPQLTVLVIVDEPKGDFYGGTVAAPAAGAIIEKTLNYLEVEKTEKTNDDARKSKVEVPDVTNMLLEDAGKVLNEAGLKFSAEQSSLGDFTLVTGQSPVGGTDVEEGSIIDLFLNPNDTNSRTMPILSGKTKEEVEKILKELKVDYNIVGEGIVIEQNPKPGKLIKLDEPIEVKLAKPLNEDSSKKDEKDSKNSKNDKTKEESNSDKSTSKKNNSGKNN